MLNIANIRQEWFVEQVESLKSKGIPYNEIASRIDVKPQYLNAIKSGKRNASEKITAKLCKAFEINHNELLSRISNHQSEISEVREPNQPFKPSKKIPLSYTTAKDTPPCEESDEVITETPYESEWIDVGDLFQDATSAVRHYGDSMIEYPSGSILILKQVVDPSIIVWGRNYYIETKDLGITKRLQDGGKDHVIGYSSNEKKSPDGRLVHEPVKIPKKSIQRISLVLGCVTNEFSRSAIPVTAKPV